MNTYAEYRALKPLESHRLPRDGRGKEVLAEVKIGKVGDRWLVAVSSHLAGRTFGSTALGYWRSTGPQVSWATRGEALEAAVARIAKHCVSGARDSKARVLKDWAAGLLAMSDDLFAHAT